MKVNEIMGHRDDPWGFTKDKMKTLVVTRSALHVNKLNTVAFNTLRIIAYAYQDARDVSVKAISDTSTAVDANYCDGLSGRTIHASSKSLLKVNMDDVLTEYRSNMLSRFDDENTDYLHATERLERKGNQQTHNS